MLNVPVNESLAFRFAGYHSEEDGYVDNLSGGDDLVSHENDGLRGSLAWNGDQTSVDLVLDYEQRDQSPTIYSMLDGAGNPVTGDHLTVDTDLLDRGVDETDVFNLSLTVERELESSTLVSITGFRSYEFLYAGEDFDGSAIPLFDYVQDQEGDYFSQELRLVSHSDSNLQWFVGASYFMDEVDVDFSLASDEETICFLFVGFACGDLIPGFSANPAGYVERGAAEGEYWGASIYGDVSYRFNDQWKLTGGIRYSYDDKEFSITSLPIMSEVADNFGRLEFLYGFDTAGEVKSSDTWSYLNPRVMLEFTPNDNWLFYGSVTNGTKPGAFDSFSVADITPGFPASIASIGTDVNSADEEDVWSYEVGAKGTFYDGRATLALSAYLYDYEDLQQQIFTGVVTVTENVGEAEGKGIEAELVVQPNEYLQFSAAGAWQEAEMEEIGLDVCTTITGGSCVGNTLPFSPELSASGQMRITIPVGNSIVYFISEFVYSDDFYQGLENTPLQNTDSWTEWNFRLGADIGDNLNVSLFVDNATDEEHFDGTADLTADLGFAIGFGPARPRTYGVDLRYRFGG